MRAGLPAWRTASARSIMSADALASLSPPLAFFCMAFRRRSSPSMSASISSVSTVSASRMGSMPPSTWVMSSSSKQRSTWTMASTSRMLPRNWLPSPSPLLAPRIRPAISTNSNWVGMILADLAIAAILSSRGSGTPTRPTFGSLVQNGKFAASAAWVAVSALNRVDLPTFGRPTMPQLKPMGNAAAFKNNPTAAESRPLQASICGTDR